MGEDAREAEGPLAASSEAHARQQGLLGVGEDSREVDGPLWASSEAHARQQGIPRLCEQDAREVGGYDDDEADYGDNDSEAAQGPASSVGRRVLTGRSVGFQ